MPGPLRPARVPREVHTYTPTHTLPRAHIHTLPRAHTCVHTHTHTRTRTHSYDRRNITFLVGATRHYDIRDLVMEDMCRDHCGPRETPGDFTIMFPSDDIQRLANKLLCEMTVQVCAGWAGLCAFPLGASGSPSAVLCACCGHCFAPNSRAPVCHPSSALLDSQQLEAAQSLSQPCTLHHSPLSRGDTFDLPVPNSLAC